MSDNSPLCCAKCGFRATPGLPPSRRRALIRVVDELGVSALCDLCVTFVLGRLGASGELTLFVDRPGCRGAPPSKFPITG